MMTVKEIETLASQIRAIHIIRNDEDFDELMDSVYHALGKEYGMALVKLHDEFYKSREVKKC